MNIRNLIAANIVLAAIVATPLSRGAEMTRFDAKPGSKVRLEGTSTMHDWQVEGKLIGGFMEVGPGFPTEPGQAATPGKIEAKVDAFIPVRSMTSLKKDGTPYSTAMDDIMYQKLLAPPHSRILFRLNDLVLKEAAKSKDEPYVFDATGELVVAGVTNKLTLPVKVTPQGEKKLKISGSTKLKMTDFKIDPPAPAIAGGAIKTGDDVTLTFDWVVGQKAAAK